MGDLFNSASPGLNHLDFQSDPHMDVSMQGVCKRVRAECVQTADVRVRCLIQAIRETHVTPPGSFVSAIV